MSGSQLQRAYIDGVALWASMLPGWELAREVLASRAPAPATPAPRPSPELLPPNERRRAPDSVAIALHAALSACQHAGREPASLRSVFSSMHGDLAITDYMCSTLASDPKLVSPTRFHNSVHNAAAGYWSIGAASARPYTSLSAGDLSFAVGLLESLLQVASTREDVLFVSYDIEARGPLAGVAPSRGLLAAALVLAPHPGERCVARVDWDFVRGQDAVPTAARPANAALVAGNSNEPCLPLLEALALGAEAEVISLVSPGLALRLRVGAPRS
jgi:Beta-ketoacyl synthase, N-terminal domain